jgi:CRISPR/Cas system-associated endonuclease Cas1
MEASVAQQKRQHKTAEGASNAAATRMLTEFQTNSQQRLLDDQTARAELEDTVADLESQLYRAQAKYFTTLHYLLVTACDAGGVRLARGCL